MRKNFNNQEIHKSLTDSEQKLLMKYYDGECGSFQNWLVERKLNSESSWADQTLQFLASLEEVSQESKVELDIPIYNIPDNKLKVNWDEIEAKIMREESLARASQPGLNHQDHSLISEALNSFLVNPLLKIFTLKPLIENSTSFASSLKFSRMVDKVSWATMGGMATASALLFTLNIGMANFSEDSKSAKSAASNISTVNLQNGMYREIGNGSITAARQNYDFQRPLRYRINRPTVDIDWIKTDKSVRLINSPREKAPIIWIKKGSGQQRTGRNGKEAPYAKNEAQDQFFTVEKVYDNDFGLGDTDVNFKRDLSFEGYK